MSNTSKPNYRVLDHTADFAFEVRARDFSELMAAGILACSDAMWGIENLRPVVEAEMTIPPADREMALYQALSETVFLFETRGLIPVEVHVEEIGEDGWRVRMRCDRHDPNHHIHRVLFKAATLHGLKIRKTRDGGLAARVVMDT